MDVKIPSMYREYGLYSNWRNLPSELDGLKPVERRVLYSAYKIAKKFVKSRQVDAYTIGHFHPHGECLTGETKILLLNGSLVKIKNLINRQSFWVYSCTSEGVIKPGFAHSARVVKKVSEIYRIHLDNGRYFECTEDHPVMMRNGKFKKAKDLDKNDSLMPLYLRKEVRRHNRIITKIEIIKLDKPIEVYDISVEKYHNFAIECGVFVHNCYGTIVHLVRQGFLDGQGNFGSNVGVDVIGPAAPRYTECKISQKSLDLFFKYIDYVSFIDTELGDKEPEYLPVMFPVCLIGKEYSQGIGFGYKTFIPCYTEKDLFKRLEYLLGIKKRKPTIYPITNSKITSPKETLEQLLTKGKARINVSGIIKPNSAKNTVSLLSWPPGKRFQNLLNKFATELNENMIGFTDLSTNKTHVLFQVLRERNRDKIFRSFVDKLTEAIKGAISFEIIVSCKNGVSVKSVDDMLLETFTRFVSVSKHMLESKKTALLNRIEELILLEKIRRPLSNCINKKLDYDETIKEVSDLTSISINVVSGLVDKYKIKKLLSLSIDTATLQHKISELSKQLRDVRSFVLEKYQEILNI